MVKKKKKEKKHAKRQKIPKSRTLEDLKVNAPSQEQFPRGRGFLTSFDKFPRHCQLFDAINRSTSARNRKFREEEKKEKKRRYYIDFTKAR